MKKILVTILFTFTLSAFITAQETPNESDAKYTPPADSPFGKPSKGSVSSSGSGNYYPIKNALLVEPFWFGRGVLGGTYSRQLSKNGLVATVGFGLQTRTDIIMGEFLEVALDNDGSTPDYVLSPLDQYNYSTFKSGLPMFQISGTYYWDYDEMEGGGVEFGFRRQRFNMSLNYEDLDEVYGTDDVSFQGSDEYLLTATSIFVNYKLQWKGTGRVPFVHSLSYGAGFKTLTYDKFSYEYSNGVFDQVLMVKNEGETQRSRPFITVMFSYSLGIGW